MQIIPIAPHHVDGCETAEELIAAGYAALHADDLAQAEHLFRRALQHNVRSAAAWRALAATQVGARQSICLRWALSIEAATHTARPPQPAHTRHLPRRMYHLGLVGALSGSALAILLVGSDIAYRDRVLPGVEVESLRVGNMSLNAARDEIIQHQERRAQRLIKLHAGDRSWRVPLNSLIHNQPADPATQAVEYGHEAEFWRRAETRLWAFLGNEYVVGGPTINAEAVQQVATAIKTQVDKARQDAHVVHTAQGWVTVPDQPGLSVDQAQMIAQLTQLLRHHAHDDTNDDLVLTVAVRQDAPHRTVTHMEPVRQRLHELAAQPMTVRSGEHQWMMDRSMLIDADTMIDPAVLKPSVAAITEQVDVVAATLAVSAQPSQLVREGGRVKQVVPGQPGRALDRNAAVDHIVKAIVENAPVVDLPIREVPPPPGEVEQLGIIAEIGRGESQFLTYSSPERDANVRAGGNDIDGVLLAPGEVFSFTQAVGDITWEKGYRWGEMIEAGVVVPSLGGGICQVSTTAFRAAFWSGLEIVERHNHSWRLPWYEVDSPPGMDATIALGGPDLKFRNNTQRHILIKVETDLERKRQIVIIYGTPDGRKVEMQARNSGNPSIYRNVVQGTQVLADEVFASYYTQ